MGNESRLGRAALALVVIGVAAGCTELKGVNGNKSDCGNSQTSSSTYDLHEGTPLEIGGSDTGVGLKHPKITLVSDGNGDATLINTSSGSNRAGLDFQDGKLTSVAFVPDGDPIVISGDTIIFDDGKSDMDFSIKVSPGQNGNTRFDVTATCPTS